MKIALAFLCLVFSSCSEKSDLPKRNKITRYPIYNQKIIAANNSNKTEIKNTIQNDKQVIKPTKIEENKEITLIDMKNNSLSVSDLYKNDVNATSPTDKGYVKRKEINNNPEMINVSRDIYTNDDNVKVINGYPSNDDIQKTQSMTLFSENDANIKKEKPRFEQKSISYDEVPAKYVAKKQDEIDFRQKFSNTKNGSYYVVVGDAFNSQYRADVEKKRLMRLSDQPVIIRQSDDAMGYVVALGPFDSHKNASANALRIAKLGYDNIAVASKMP
jgi:hypothetical protein